MAIGRTSWLGFLTISLIVMIAAGCAAGDPADEGKKDEPPGGGKSDRWDYANDPARFGVPLEARLDLLPRQGRARTTPWSETYWPTTEDSMNARWQGPSTLSPLEKYDLAFNGWRPAAGFMSLRPLTAESCRTGAWDRAYYDQLGPAAKFWSDTKGVGRARNGRDDDGDGKVDECDDLDGMEYWWGSCHAWTPASILEPEPLEAVTVNGVRFEPSDVKALLILLYDESRQIAIGDRCTLTNPPRDANGRILDGACRNTNAGAFHLLMTNLLGLEGRAFAEDRVADAEVWNQPLAGYRVVDQREVTLPEALAALGLGGDRYPFNADAKRFVTVTADLDYIVESHPSTQPSTPHIDRLTRTDRYRYLLELDDAGRVIGGEWIAARSGGTFAQNDRPDYLWLPLGPGRNPNPYVRADVVRDLLRRSRPDLRDQLVKSYADEVDLPIPDYPWAGVKRTITVPDELTLSAATVHLEILHSWAYDVRVVLRRAGREIVLFDRNPIGSSTVAAGAFPVPDVAGQPAAGEWTLEVSDRDGRNIGRLVRWSLELTGHAATPPPPPVDPPAPTPPAPTTKSYQAPGGALDIPDNQPAGITSTIPVADDFVVGAAEVSVTIRHPYRGDLRVSLIHNGAEVVLTSRSGGAEDDLVKTFAVPTFAGVQAKGDWSLKVADLAARDAGRLEGWSLKLISR